MRIASHGIQVDLPEGWEGRIYRRTEGNPILHAGNFALPAEDGDFGTAAISSMHSGGIFIALAEYSRDVLGEPLFGQDGMPLPLGPDDAHPRALQRLAPGRAGLQRFFTVSGRPFCLYVVLASAPDRQALIDQANSVLSSMVVDAGGSP